MYAQAKVAAYTAAGAAARAAAATLASLEKVTAMYTSTRQYYMLDDLAETSTQAKRVRPRFPALRVRMQKPLSESAPVSV